jgi:hypothetical protein
MPDPFQYTMALLAAFAVSVIAVAGARKVLRLRAHRLANVVEVFGITAGLIAGYRVLQFELVWPPANAITRFLTIVLPAAVIVELISGFACIPTQSEARRLKGAGLPSFFLLILRIGFFASIGRILLHNSVYLGVSPNIAGTWSGWQMFILLTASAVLLTAMWLLLSNLAKRDGPGSVASSLSMSIMTAGISIMLAGYIKGGVAAFPFAASLTGVVAIAQFVRPNERSDDGRFMQGTISLGVTALFSLLWVGYFFGQLPAIDAVVIFLAPVLCWVSELSFFRRMNSRRRGLLRLACVAIPLLIQLLIAKRTFDQKLAPLLAFQVSW